MLRFFPMTTLTVSAASASSTSSFNLSEFFGLGNLKRLLQELEQGKAAKVMSTLVDANLATRNQPLTINSEALKVLKQLIKELAARCDRSVTRTKEACNLNRVNPMDLIGRAGGTGGRYGVVNSQSFNFMHPSSEAVGGPLLSINYSRNMQSYLFEMSDVTLWNSESNHGGKMEHPRFTLKGDGLIIVNGDRKKIFSG